MPIPWQLPQKLLPQILNATLMEELGAAKWNGDFLGHLSHSNHEESYYGCNELKLGERCEMYLNAQINWTLNILNSMGISGIPWNL